MAEKKGGKEAATSPNDLMTPADMRPILAQAKRGNPASCAIALTRNKDGVILLDLDNDPFVPLSIQKTMTSTLTALSKGNQVSRGVTAI